MAKLKRESVVTEDQVVDQSNVEQAKIIFAAMPHIQSIWFDQEGGWRYYPTPGAIPIHKEDITAE